VDRIREHGHDLPQERCSVHLGGGFEEGDVGELAHPVDGQDHVKLALSQTQLAVVDVNIADRGLGEATPLGGFLALPGQPRDAVPNKAAVKGAAGQLGMLSRRHPRTSSSGSNVRRLNSTTMASSASVRVVLRGRLGPIG